MIVAARMFVIRRSFTQFSKYYSVVDLKSLLLASEFQLESTSSIRKRHKVTSIWQDRNLHVTPQTCHEPRLNFSTGITLEFCMFAIHTVKPYQLSISASHKIQGFSA